MAGLSAGSGGGFDYIQSAEPADPENAELWFDTDGGTDGNGEVKVYDGSQWDTTGYVSHDQLTNVSPADHHDPVTVSAPIIRSQQALALAFGNALTLDSNDDLAVDESAISLSSLSGYPVGTGDLGFDTATQSDLNSHESDTSNPHSVDHSQLSGVGSNDHHSRYTDSEARSATRTVLASGSTYEGSGYYTTYQGAGDSTIYLGNEFDGKTTELYTTTQNVVVQMGVDSSGYVNWEVVKFD